MKIRQTLLFPLGALSAALALLAGPVRADDGGDTTTSRLKFTDPAKPGTLKATLPWANVHVIGTDGNEIVVTSTLDEKGRKEERKDGLRRLDEEVAFALTEKNNVALLQIVGDNPWSAHGAEFKIELPHNTALVLRTEAGGDLQVDNIDGDIDINSMNGEVTLRDVSSSAVVSTMNGEINAVFKSAPLKPVSFSSMNGEILVKVPAETKANLRLRSHNGAILTDFPESVLKARTEDRGGIPMPDSPEAADKNASGAGMTADQAMREANRAIHDANREAQRAAAEAQQAMGAADAAPARAPRAPRAPRVPMVPSFGGKSVIGTLNGGGVDIQLATMNGTITLRQVK